MKSAYRTHAFPSIRFLTAILAIFFTLCAGPANAAIEPGTVIVVLSAEPVNLDPGTTARAIEGQILMRNIVETLTDMNPADSSIVPRLATSWKQIDGNTWHFFLRKGVKFHDGADFNADAVLFNIKRLFDSRTLSQTKVQFFSNFKMEGKALDSYTLEIKTDKFQPLMPALMATFALCSPKTAVDKLVRDPVGTGPYKFAKWDTGTNQVFLERFDGYWGKQPQVKKAIFTWRTESAVRAAMVEIGEADLAPIIAEQDAKRPDLDQSYLNSETSALRIGGAWEPPFNDRRVRMALNLAIDRNALKGSILSKDVVPATQLVVPSTFGYNPDMKVWPYDPKKAKQLLDEARKDGVPVDKEILLLGRYGIFPGDQELMEAVMTMYSAVGFNVKMKMIEQGQYRPYNVKPYPPNAGLYIIQKQHDNNKGDAAFTFFMNYACDGGQSSMCDKQVDDLIEKAQVATGEERKKLWQAAFKRAQEEIISDVPLFHMVGFARIGKRINYKPTLATNNEISLASITFK